MIILVKSTQEKLSATVKKLSMRFGFGKNDWSREGFHLLIGSLIMKIRYLWEKGYVDEESKKQKNPELYWQTGREINEFIVMLITSIEKEKKEITLIPKRGKKK